MPDSGLKRFAGACCAVVSAAGSMFSIPLGHGYPITGVALDRRSGGVGHASAPDRRGPRSALIMVRMAAKTTRRIATSTIWKMP